MNKLDEIEARLKAATPGPWKGNGDSWQAQMRTVFSYTKPHTAYPYVGIPGQIAQHVRIADADFIANAPQDIEYLLALVRSVADEECELVLHGRSGVTCFEVGVGEATCHPCRMRKEIQK